MVLRVSTDQMISDGRPERKYRGRDPRGSRPVSEDGLACQALHERDRASDVIGGSCISQATLSAKQCYDKRRSCA